MQLALLRRRSGWVTLRLILAAGIAALGVQPAHTNADAVTGTWTGAAQLRAMVVKQGVSLAAIGVVIGLLLARALGGIARVCCSK